MSSDSDENRLCRVCDQKANPWEELVEGMCVDCVHEKRLVTDGGRDEYRV